MSLTPESPRCGNCAFFAGEHTDERSGEIMGECRYGSWPPIRPSTSHCRDHVPAGALGRAGAGTLVRAREDRASHRAITLRKGVGDARHEPQPILRAPRAPIDIEVDDMDEATFRGILREILAEELGLSNAPMAERWRGGELVLHPGREGTPEKRIPLDKFFHKIVMLRDKLRVLEQKVNGNPALAPEDKVNLQQYITGCYGSLTTFNVLFAEDDDRFVGQGEKE